MLDINVEWDTPVYMFEKPHYWSLGAFAQDDGFGNALWVGDNRTNEAVYAFISEDLH